MTEPIRIPIAATGQESVKSATAAIDSLRQSMAKLGQQGAPAEKLAKEFANLNGNIRRGGLATSDAFQQFANGVNTPLSQLEKQMQRIGAGKTGIASGVQQLVREIKTGATSTVSAIQQTSKQVNAALEAAAAAETSLRERHMRQSRFYAFEAARASAKSASDAKKMLRAASSSELGTIAMVNPSAAGSYAPNNSNGLSAMRAFYLAQEQAAGGANKLAEATVKSGAAAKNAAPHLMHLNGVMKQGHSLARGLASGFNAMWLTWGSLAPLLIGAAISGSFVKALKSGAEVAENLADIRELAGATGADIEKMSKAISGLAESTAYGPVETSNALKVLSLAGLDAKESLMALKPTLDFSMAGGMDAERSAETLIAVATAYGYSADQISVVGDMIAKTAAVSMSSVDKMSGSFRVASAVAQQFGVTLEDSALNLAFLSQIGITGTAAGTAMRNFYQHLVAGSGPAEKALKSIGMEVLDLTTGKVKPYMQIIAELDVHLSKYTYKEQQRLSVMMTTNRGMKDFSASLEAYRTKVRELEPEQEKQIQRLKRTGQEEAAARLQAELSMTQFKRMKQQLADAPGFTAIAAAGKSITPENQMKALKAALENDLVKAFEKVSDALYVMGARMRAVLNSDEFRTAMAGMVRIVANFVEGLVSTIVWLNKHSEALRGAATALGVLVTGFVAYKLLIGPITVAMGFFTTGLVGARTALIALNAGLLATPAGWIALVAAVVAGGAAYLAFGSDAKGGLSEAKRAEDELASANRQRNTDFLSSLSATLQGYKDREKAAKELRSVEEIQAERALKELNARADGESALTLLRLANEKSIAIAQATNRGWSEAELEKHLEMLDKQAGAVLAANNKMKSEAAKLIADVRAAAIAEAARLKITTRPQGPLGGGDGANGGTGANGKLKNSYNQLESAINKVREATEVEMGVSAKKTAADEFRIKLTEDLALALKNKTLTQSQHDDLKGQVDAVEALMKESVQRQALTKIYEENVAARKSLTATNTTAVEKLEEEIVQQKLHNDSIGLSKDAVAELEAANISLQAAKLESLAIDQLIQHQDTTNYHLLLKQAEALRELARLKREGGAKQAAADTAKEAREAWDKAADSIEKSLTDALMRGFEGGKGLIQSLKDSIVNTFKTMVLRPIVQAVTQPMAQGLAGLMGTGASGSAMASSGGGADVGSMFSSVNRNIGTAITEGFGKLASSSAGQAMGLSNSTAITGNNLSAYVPAGGQLTAFGAKMSSAAGAIGSTMAGYAMGSMARTMISNGYSMGKGMDNFQKVGIAVASAVGGPVMGAIAGAVTGLINRGFGRKLKDTGLQGSFGGEAGFSGNNYKFEKGGWFRSDKTTLSALGDGVQSGLAQQFKALQISTAMTAQQLGLSADKVAAFTADIKLSFKGLTEEQISEKLTEEFGKVADGMANAVAPTLKKFTREGETANETLTRLGSSLSTSNVWLKALGLNLYEVSLAGGNMASALADAFGGLDAMTSASKSYSELFYSESEKAHASYDGMTKVLAQINLTMPTSKDGFRNLVTSLNLTTEAGRQAYATLLSIAPEFVSTTDTLARLNGEIIRATLQELKAAQATLPGSGGLSSSLNQTSKTAFGAFMADSEKLQNRFFNTSLEAVNELAAETTRMYEGALSLVQQISDATQESSARFAESKRTVQLDVLDTAGKYNYFDQEIARYTDVLRGLVDPTAIADYSSKIEQSIMAGWGLLTDDQKKSTEGDYLRLLSNADDLTKGRYQAASDLTVDTARANNQATADTISKSITEALNREAQMREYRAEAQHQAALAAAKALKDAADAIAAATAAEAAARRTAAAIVVTVQNRTASELTVAANRDEWGNFSGNSNAWYPGMSGADGG